MAPSILVYLTLILNLFFYHDIYGNCIIRQKKIKNIVTILLHPHLADSSGIFNGSGSAPLTHINSPDSMPSFGKHSHKLFRPALSSDKHSQARQVYKREKFFVSDFEFFTILQLVKLKLWREIGCSAYTETKGN